MTVVYIDSDEEDKGLLHNESNGSSGYHHGTGIHPDPNAAGKKYLPFFTSIGESTAIVSAGSINSPKEGDGMPRSRSGYVTTTAFF